MGEDNLVKHLLQSTRVITGTVMQVYRLYHYPHYNIMFMVYQFLVNKVVCEHAA